MTITAEQLALLDDLDWSAMVASIDQHGVPHLQHRDGAPFDPAEMETFAPLTAQDFRDYSTMKQAGFDQADAAQHDLETVMAEVQLMFRHYNVAALGELVDLCTDDERAKVMHLVALLRS